MNKEIINKLKDMKEFLMEVETLSNEAIQMIIDADINLFTSDEVEEIFELSNEIGETLEKIIYG